MGFEKIAEVVGKVGTHVAEHGGTYEKFANVGSTVVNTGVQAVQGLEQTKALHAQTATTQAEQNAAKLQAAVTKIQTDGGLSEKEKADHITTAAKSYNVDIKPDEAVKLAKVKLQQQDMAYRA